MSEITVTPFVEPDTQPATIWAIQPEAVAAAFPTPIRR